MKKQNDENNFVADLPSGFGMKLMQEPTALQNFANLPENEKAAMVSDIKGAQSGKDARERVARAINSLQG